VEEAALTEPEIPMGIPTIRARRRSGWRAVMLDSDMRTVKVPAGIKLDLGATAKAWAADRAARVAAEAVGVGALVSLGGDIATAGMAPAEGWRVRVTDDHRSAPDAPGQTVRIHGGGLATSSTAVRRWITADGARMHHILDPRTESPVRGRWRTVSVAAATCLDANIAATAAIVRSQAAGEWLADLHLPARLVACNGTVICVAGWPQDSLHRARPQELVLASLDKADGCSFERKPDTRPFDHKPDGRSFDRKPAFPRLAPRSG
jgi:thiamine biosynthesis lipoprotein